MLLKLKIGLKLRCCAKLSASCEETNGDSEDARRPCKNLRKPSNTFKAIYTCMCTPERPTECMTIISIVNRLSAICSPGEGNKTTAA
eukprot:8039873-Heterocapsa_arctica.AAC.1